MERISSSERLHRPFVLAALLVTLTLGAGWGAYLLFQIGWRGSFDAASQAQVIAHGAAQLWGFVAVFIVGISLRYLFTATARPAPGRAARASLLVSLLAGVLAGFVWSLTPAALPFLGLASGIALVAGSAVYCALIGLLLSGKARQVWARNILASGWWLLVWAVWTLFLQGRAGPAGAAAFMASDRQIVMDLALFGLALGSVYGFGQKLLPGFLSIGQTRRGFFEVTFWLHHIGLTLLLAGRLTQLNAAAIAGTWSIAIGAIAYVCALRGLRGRRVPNEPRLGSPLLKRYIQLAFAWLCVSTLGFAVIETVQSLAAVEAPHSIVGAIRHALTVGFLVTLILGVAQRLLPILSHTSLAWPSLAAPIFLLIGAGNFLRVASEAATLWWPAAFFVMPFSSLLELAALALFAANAIRTMWPGR